ncbi:MAG: cytochrome ubiquinol oxidase subunit I [Coriobacteriales bacterium]|jgi:cytochrome d ubiquinol oxidase subunit I
MDLFSDPVFLGRLQFAITVIFHFLYVPLSVGLGLIVAIAQTRAHKTKDPKDEATARFWIRVFALTFTVGVATGITMEFSFGTNWADYSRFVGDIFGSPLAAEALFAFFLESTFLGVLIFGRDRISTKFRMVSAWLVWAGSMLSALWILIANSWMQTPAGYTVEQTTNGAKAVMTDFFQAAFNPETIPTYLHTVLALIILGAFVAMAVAAYYHLHNRNEHFVKNVLRWGAIVATVAGVLMMPAAHMQAKVVSDYQPTKLAAMEGHYETESVPMYLFGWVDTDSQEVQGISIEGLTSWLITGDPSSVYPGLNDLEEQKPGSTPDSAMVQATFQSYHIMIVMMGVIVIGIILALVLSFRKKKSTHKWPWVLLMILWIAPLLAIETGWLTAEFGRQPWIVYGLLKTSDAISQAVPAWQLLVTIVLFVVVYLLIIITWIRLFAKFVKEGPEKYETALVQGSQDEDGAQDAPVARLAAEGKAGE